MIVKTSKGLAEVKLSYVTNVKDSDRPKITCSDDAAEILRTVFDPETIELQESAVILLINRANKLIGWYNCSVGGSTQTIMEVKFIVLAAILSTANQIILSHNHPSGNLTPSTHDVKLTKQIKDAANLFDIAVIDHIIMTAESYHSMADEGEI